MTFDSDSGGNNDSVKLMFNITSDTNTSLFGNVTACLYNSSGKPASYLNITGLLPLIKDNTTSTFLNLTLFSNQSADNYTASLVLMDIFDNVHSVCNQTIYLAPYGKPVADFRWQHNGDKNYSFTDLSLPSPGAHISNWTWDFGDGNNSFEQNPYNVYYSAGDYNVTLTIIDDNGKNDSETKKLTVSNTNANVDMSLSKTYQKVAKVVNFNSLSSDPDGAIVNSTWYFGDGTISYGTSTTHSYSQSGLYTVILVVTDNDGATSSTTSNIIIADTFANASLGRSNQTDGNFTTIQKAADNTSDGGVVYVIGGEYTNGVVVNKSLSFYGEKDNTVISAPLTGVSIVSNNVSMDSFIVKDTVIGIAVSGRSNCTITECDFLNSTSGVKIDDGAEQNMITSCNFSNNTYGVYISGSESNIVGSPSFIENPVWDDCIFTYNNYGVYIEGGEANYIMGCKINATLSGPGSPSSGIYIDNSKNNTILLCDVVNASNYGIYISGSSNNTILNCIVRENDKGVYLSSSSYNSIIGNNISKNSESGVNILTASSSSNSILFNDFIGNGGVFYPQASDSGTGNNWNTSNNNTYLYSGQGEGNNWSDYTGSDSDGDGIGDTSNSISGTANGKDYYPVMMDYGWLDKWY